VSNKQILSCAKYSLFYLSPTFNLSFTNTAFHNTSTGESKKIFTLSLGNTRMGMIKFL